MGRLKILFVNPETFDKAEGYTKEDLSFIGFPSLSAAVVGALTPPELDFEAIDEAVDPLATKAHFDRVDADVVAISLNMSYKANRAIRIATEFMERGKKVIWGGVHVTSLYDHHRDRFEKEILPYAHAVVLGEAEEVWATLCQDLLADRLQKIYRAHRQPPPDLWPQPRYAVVNTRDFLVKHSRQATRGCPLDCEFCAVTSFNGSRFRRLDVKRVVADIRQALQEVYSRSMNALQRVQESFFAFVDDNISFDRRYFTELLFELIEVKKDFPAFSWGGQTTLYTIDKKVRYKGREYDLGDLMERSGCIAMFVGVESVSKESLAIANKNFNDVDRYPDQIKKFHDHGIMLNAGMVLGFDSDTERVFEDTYEFLVRNKIEASLLNILTPLPGTALYRRYVAEGRIFDHNWEHYDGRHVVYYPSRMTPERLEEGFMELWKALYSTGSIARRILYPAQVLRGIRSALQGNLNKLEQIVGRWALNRRFAKVSARIRTARRSLPRNRFGENITFGELLLRRHEDAVRRGVFSTCAGDATPSEPLVQLGVP